MPEFIFKINNEVHYSTKLTSLRCEDTNKKGGRCKRKCVIGSPYCYTHLAYKHHLTIKKSTIPNAGNGLFAVDPLSSDKSDIIYRKGDTIIKYFGEIINLNELIARYADKTGPYVVQMSQNRYMDAAKIRGVGSLANTLPNNNNATLSVSHNSVSLKATKNIKNGDEILLSYGRGYKLNENGVDFQTKK